MSTAPSVQDKQTQKNNRAGLAPLLTLGLTVTALLTIRFYFVRELLTIFATMAVLFAVGTSGLLLLVVLQEIGRWIVLGIGLTIRVTVSSQRTQISSELTKCAVPKAIEGKTGIWIGSEARQCDIGKMTTNLLKRLVVNSTPSSSVSRRIVPDFKLSTAILVPQNLMNRSEGKYGCVYPELATYATLGCAFLPPRNVSEGSSSKSRR